MRAVGALAALRVTALLGWSGDSCAGGAPHEARKGVGPNKAGGPFLYPNDGRIFGNREAHLPKRSRGYYREYTVPTPAARDRGARRIVAGRGGELYYTEDHYRTFKRIIE